VVFGALFFHIPRARVGIFESPRSEAWDPSTSAAVGPAAAKSAQKIESISGLITCHDADVDFFRGILFVRTISRGDPSSDQGSPLDRAQ